MYLRRLALGVRSNLSGTKRFASTFKQEYDKHVQERAAQGIVPKALNANQTSQLVELLKSPPKGEEDFLVDLLSNRIAPGVDEAAYVKAAFLAAVVKGDAKSPLVSRKRAVELLGTMQGGYNVAPLIEALDDKELGGAAGEALAKTLLVFEAFNDVAQKAKSGHAVAKDVMEKWARAYWFLERPEVKEEWTLTVFKVPGETNTDDLSPAPDAWSRPDIPLHALAMLKNPREGVAEDVAGKIAELKKKGHPLVYVGDVVGTGSSRKSAVNSVLWYMGDDIPHVPNKRTRGFTIGTKIAPIFYNTMQDSGGLPIEMDVSKLNTGDVITINLKRGTCTKDGKKIEDFQLRSPVLLDEFRAGGRINLIICRGLALRAREFLNISKPDVLNANMPPAPKAGNGSFSLAQKLVGKACGLPGVVPGQYCEPLMTTVGSQDTTGPMTRDELKDLACLGFSADLVMQSFCHTAAYPKPVDLETQHSLPDFIMNRGGVSLRPGDGIIHSWLNRMLIPDTVGTGGDSHTRFPLGISFPAGSGLVAFAAATGTMPLDMPESVLVRFSGQMQPGITLRDLVHAIPYAAIQKGLLTVEKTGKKNIFSGRILEIEGLEHLKCEQAFELSDASAERSAAGCTINLDEAPIREYLNSNVTMLKWMVDQGYGDKKTILRRVARMMAWLENPKLLRADKHAEYAAVIDINLNEVKEPLLCAPNDPDDVKPLSAVANDKIDEVFIGSCMTNIGHFRAAGKVLDKFNKQVPTKLWICPPTKMDAAQLESEGYYKIFGKVGARTEMPGCSLCMGNQARVEDKANVVSTSTRNFPNRLGKGARVYLASAELAAAASLLGRLPTVEEYQKVIAEINTTAADTYRYLNFNKIDEFVNKAKNTQLPDSVLAAAREQQQKVASAQ